MSPRIRQLADTMREGRWTLGDANKVQLLEEIVPLLAESVTALENELNQLRERCDERKTQMTRDINRLKGVHGL